MLDDKTLEWLELRKNLCTHCGRREWCRIGNKHKFNTAKCRFWEPFAWQVSDHICIEDFRDVAEFEARVSEMLATVICAGCEDFNKKDVCPLAIYQTTGIYECRMKHARLAVEREMIAEGKGPGK